MPGLVDLVGRSFGPHPVDVTPSRVRDLVAAVGDDDTRWETHVPPYFANAVLFAAAPSFLEDEAVRPFTRALIHSEQSFTWYRPLVTGDALDVLGRVESVRARGPLHLVSFAVEAESGDGPWITGSSLFLMSAEAAGEPDEAPEPPTALRPPVDPMPAAPLPLPGERLATLRVGASRADLLEYASASGDWNPIHWDHRAARAAGLPGTIVHGLLMSAWMIRAASRLAPGPRPLATMRARFRSPLRPGIGAELGGSVLAVEDDGAEIDLTLGSGGDSMVTARVRVTR